MATKLTKEELDEWREKNARRLELDRESKALDERCKQILAKATDLLKESGKASIKRFGFTLAWIAGRATVAWKDAFLKECGSDKAAELQAEAAKNVEKKISVTPPLE